MKQLSTQDFLEIDQIRDGIVILKNKGLRAILMVSSLNFALKSDDEQKSIIFQFQNFLNSLDFSCQIVVQSRRLNMTGYIDKLKNIEEKEKNDLLKTQIYEYREFIKGLIKEGSIMSKSFYVIVPFSPFEVVGSSEDVADNKKLFGKFDFSEAQFQRAKIQLLQRAEFVLLGLRACGLQSVILNNLEIIELFWSLYHPIEAEKGYYPEIPLEIINE